MKLAALILLSCFLSGCALFEPPKAETQVVDTFCLQKKRMWSINDSVETIREAEVHNAALDRRCGIPGKKTS